MVNHNKKIDVTIGENGENAMNGFDVSSHGSTCIA